jgi:hypothetical protein
MILAPGYRIATVPNKHLMVCELAHSHSLGPRRLAENSENARGTECAKVYPT